MKRKTGESFDEFKIRRRATNQFVRDKLKGTMLWVSKSPHVPRGTGRTLNYKEVGLKKNV